MNAEAKHPQHAKCRECGHVFVVALLPMEAGKVAMLFKAARCHACASKSLVLWESNDVPADAPLSASPNILQWLAHGERGTSSNTIVQHLTGIQACRGPFSTGYPYDPDDLRRCRLLLDQCPELKPLLPKMAELGPVWAGLAAEWDDLCRVMDEELADPKNKQRMCKRTYDRMWAIRKAGGER